MRTMRGRRRRTTFKNQVTVFFLSLPLKLQEKINLSSKTGFNIRPPTILHHNLKHRQKFLIIISDFDQCTQLTKKLNDNNTGREYVQRLTGTREKGFNIL